MEPPRQAVKMTGRAYAELKRLTAEAARHGWSAFGIDRDDTPTQSALMEEAIRLLAARLDSTNTRRSKR